MLCGERECRSERGVRIFRGLSVDVPGMRCMRIVIVWFGREEWISVGDGVD